MEKIRIDLETLTVDSFQTTPAEQAPQGTVHGLGAEEMQEKLLSRATSCPVRPPYCTC
jgi:hypothetical protein